MNSLNVRRSFRKTQVYRHHIHHLHLHGEKINMTIVHKKDIKS